MNSGNIKKSLEQFQVSVAKLSGEIGKATSVWSDPNYSKLHSEVSDIANQSKDVIVSGDKFCSSLERFNKIVIEKY